MTLKQIPLENCTHDKVRGKKQFNPGQKIKKTTIPHPMGISLKSVCVDLVHFINRDNRHTVEHLEKMIMELQRSVLWLQKNKQEMTKGKKTEKKKGA